jgi:allantoin racemase
MRILFLNKAPKRHARYNVQEIEDLLNSYASPGTKVEVGFPDDFAGSDVKAQLGKQSALNGLDHYMEQPAIIRKIVWAQDNGYDAVIQSNTFDPGVDGGRLSVKIPVLGPLRTTLHCATTLADRIGIMVPLSGHVPYTWRLMRMLGMENHITDIRPVGVYGADIAQRHDELLDTGVKVIKGLGDDGAQAVIPLGGALIPYVVSPADLEKLSGVPVFNTKAVTIRFAETCVSLGMRQSPLTYPRANLTYKDFGG